MEQISLIKSMKDSGLYSRHIEEEFYITPLPGITPLNYPFKLQDYGCCICLKGEANGWIDLMPCHLTPSSMVVNVPGQLIEPQTVSEDFQAIGIGMSQQFVKELGLPYNFHLDLMLKDAPLLHLQTKQLEAILNYCTMAQRLLEKRRPFQMETLRHLTCAFFYGIGSYLYQLSENRPYSNEEELMKNFLNEVKRHYKTQRQVQFYASRLHISQGYLSSVVKKVSGKTPTKWIDDFVITEARSLLKSTSMNVQQIGYELGFPSQSFFGKYFKRIVGVTPVAYRK
ncbi:MAG: helix-turn-helix domain-containing protein [Parabacteroides sp.]